MDTTTTDKTQRMRPGLPEELSIVYTEETELHWQRIISAILIVLAVLTVLGWILMNTVSAEKAAQVITAEPDVLNSIVEESTQTLPATELKAPVKDLESTIPALPQFEKQAEETSIPQSALPNVVQDMLPLYAHMPKKPLQAPAPPLVQDGFVQREASDSTQLTLDPNYVGTLQLTSNLSNKNPTDLLGGEINMDGQQLIKLYAYSELTNLKGERVFHEWYKGSKRMARIPVGVYLDNMRASSSKYIDPTMAGDWHLKIVRHNGEQLGRMDFRVNADS